MVWEWQNDQKSLSEHQILQQSADPDHQFLALFFILLYSMPGECEHPAFVAGGGQTRRAERGMGGQYFGRRDSREIGLPSYSKICSL
jgi:hypothetical protein